MKKLLTLMASAMLLLSTMAITPLWLRDVQISPDGQQILFCYKGDIYKVSSQGGTAIQLTTQDSYECNPLWSPDGRQVAFASDRNGNFDIYVMPADGGSAKCLTTNSAAETPWTFTPDGKYILFSATKGKGKGNAKGKAKAQAMAKAKAAKAKPKPRND